LLCLPIAIYLIVDYAAFAIDYAFAIIHTLAVTLLPDIFHATPLKRRRADIDAAVMRSMLHAKSAARYVRRHDVFAMMLADVCCHAAVTLFYALSFRC